MRRQLSLKWLLMRSYIAALQWDSHRPSGGMHFIIRDTCVIPQPKREPFGYYKCGSQLNVNKLECQPFFEQKKKRQAAIATKSSAHKSVDVFMLNISSACATRGKLTDIRAFVKHGATRGCHRSSAAHEDSTIIFASPFLSNESSVYSSWLLFVVWWTVRSFLGTSTRQGEAKWVNGRNVRARWRLERFVRLDWWSG